MMMSTAAQLDPKAPLVADARTLPRSPGAHQSWSTRATFSERLGVDLIAVPVGEPVDVSVTLTSVSEGILVTGTVSARVTGECGRCLEPIDETLSVEVSELYAFEDSATAETTDADEVMRVQGDLLDLEPTVRDALVFALPNTPLCRPDCPGLCPDCGAPWDTLPDDHTHRSVDPRWAALKDLL